MIVVQTSNSVLFGSDILPYSSESGGENHMLHEKINSGLKPSVMNTIQAFSCK